jgi:5-methylthioribose kinase
LVSAGDFTSIYDDGAVTNATVAALLDWLQQLSRVSVPVDGRAVFSNRAMRALNHEHMFVFPLRDSNGLDLDGITAGLAEEGAIARHRSSLRGCRRRARAGIPVRWRHARPW